MKSRKMELDGYDKAVLKAIENEWLTKTQIVRKTLISYTSVSSRIDIKLKKFIDKKDEWCGNHILYRLKEEFKDVVNSQ